MALLTTGASQIIQCLCYLELEGISVKLQDMAGNNVAVPDKWQNPSSVQLELSLGDHEPTRLQLAQDGPVFRHREPNKFLHIDTEVWLISLACQVDFVKKNATQTFIETDILHLPPT
jgi:hypothetical protein